MVSVAQLVEPRVVIPVVVGSSPIVHPMLKIFHESLQNESTVYNSLLPAKVAELVDALDLGSSGVTRESSSLSFRTIIFTLPEVARCKFRLRPVKA